MTTNREKLAKMTNEELAKFIYNIEDCNLCAYDYNYCNPNLCCIQGILLWLNQESEE